MLKKRIYSLFIIMSMICTSLNVNVFAENSYVEDTEINSSIIYGTDYVEKSENLSVSSTNNDGIDDKGKRVRLSADSSAELPLSIKYEFEILTPGMYKLNLVAGECAVDWLSAYNVKIDGKTVEVKESNMTSKTVVADTLNWFISGELKERFNLGRGKHTFEIEVTAYRASGSVLTCFESAEFVRESDVKEVIYGSDSRTDNISENSGYGLKVGNGQEYSSRGTTVHISGGSAATAELFPTGGFVFDYEFDVEVDGVYELSNFIAGDVDHGWLSKISVAIDNGAIKKINSNSYTSKNIISGYTVELLAEYTTNLQFYLKKGTHHFKFIIPEHNTNRNGTFTYFDKAEFTYVDDTEINNSIIYGTDSYVEKSEELTVSTKVQALAANGKRVQLAAGSGVELPQSIKYEFEILTPGMYKLNLVAGECDVDTLSKYNVKIDGKTVEVKGANMTSKTVVADTSNLFISGELKERFNLGRGTHTFEIEVTAYRASGSVLTCFESAEFVRESDVKEVIYGSASRTDNIEENSGYGLNVGNGQEYSSRGTTVHISGGSAATAELFPTGGFVFDYEFDVEVDGVYELSNFIAGDVDHSHLSKISVAIDDGVIKKINSNTYTSKALITGNNNVTLLAEYTTELQFYLSKGTHHFKFILPQHCTARQGTYTYFDKAELTYVDDTELNSSIIYGTDSYVEKSEELSVSTQVQSLAANGKRVQLSASSGVELPQSIKYEFEILTPGSYKLNLVAGECDVDWLSGYNVKIDGKTVEVKGANMTSKTVVADTSRLFISGELKERFNLDRGKHTFEIEVIAYRASGGVLTCFESAEFVRVGDAVIESDPISNVKITSNGETVDDISAVNSVVISADFADSDADKVMIVAVYNGDRLLNVGIANTAEQSGATKTVEVSEFSGASKCKFFVWDSLTTLKV